MTFPMHEKWCGEGVGVATLLWKGVPRRSSTNARTGQFAFPFISSITAANLIVMEVSLRLLDILLSQSREVFLLESHVALSLTSYDAKRAKFNIYCAQLSEPRLY